MVLGCSRHIEPHDLSYTSCHSVRCGLSLCESKVEPSPPLAEPPASSEPARAGSQRRAGSHAELERARLRGASPRQRGGRPGGTSGSARRLDPSRGGAVRQGPSAPATRWRADRRYLRTGGPQGRQGGVRLARSFLGSQTRANGRGDGRQPVGEGARPLSRSSSRLAFAPGRGRRGPDEVEVVLQGGARG